LATPPPPLIVSMALNSIGGSHLDAREHEEARAAFRQSIEWWPANGMAQTNLADLERERGSYERAIELYKSAAALPKSEWPDVVPSQWFSEWITAPRKECVALATYMSLLLLHQTLAFDEALPYMAKFGVRWRLSPAVWRAVSTPPHPEAALPLPRASAADGTMVRRVAGAIPDPLLSALQQGFSLSSPFWAETDYADRGYFSFWYDVAESPRNAVEFLCRHLRPFTGVGDEVVGCEWWVHTRAEGRSIGHQMHFDTEEGSLASGQLLHPVVSSVSYLRTSADHLFGSDPTVVLNQRVDDDSADRAWVSHPRQGSVLFFPGNLLHCVCPAKPRAARSKRSRAATSPRLLDDSEQPHRVTLMIGFWTTDVRASSRRTMYGACGPVPRPTRGCSWPARLSIPEGVNQQEEPPHTAKFFQVPTVSSNPWERVPDMPGGISSLPLAKSNLSEEWATLTLPESRKHGFFVSELSEFREALRKVD